MVEPLGSYTLTVSLNSGSVYFFFFSVYLFANIKYNTNCNNNDNTFGSSPGSKISFARSLLTSWKMPLGPLSMAMRASSKAGYL